jgi:hypothetical protein
MKTQQKKLQQIIRKLQILILVFVKKKKKFFFKKLTLDYLLLGYSDNLSSLTIPDNLRNISSSTSLFIATNNATCKRCGLQFTDHDWCHKCEARKFQENFSSWTSGNKELDEIIRNSQLNAKNYNKYFEWINFNRIKNKKHFTQDSHRKIYNATWLDGIRELWDDISQQWVRTEPVQVILQEITCLTSKNLESYLELKNVICCYGFTQDPITKSYYVVLKYSNR